MDRVRPNSGYVAGTTRLLLGPRIIGSFGVQPEGPPRDPNVRRTIAYGAQSKAAEAACRSPCATARTNSIYIRPSARRPPRWRLQQTPEGTAC